MAPAKPQVVYGMTSRMFQLTIDDFRSSRQYLLPDPAGVVGCLAGSRLGIPKSCLGCLRRLLVRLGRLVVGIVLRVLVLPRGRLLGIRGSLGGDLLTVSEGLCVALGRLLSVSCKPSRGVKEVNLEAIQTLLQTKRRIHSAK